MDSPILPPEDWDFMQVPSQELEVCRLWEYGRESGSIRTFCDRTRELTHGGLSGNPKAVGVRKEFQKLFGCLGRCSILFQEGIYGFGGITLAAGFQNPFPQAWQSLNAEQRKVLCETAKWRPRDTVDTLVIHRAQKPYVKALAEFKPESNKAVFGKDEVGVSEFFHAGNELRRICPNFFYSDGTEILALCIEWGNATNAQLVAAFSEWLKENNPPSVERPDHRGERRANISASLDWLAMTRLLHLFTRAEVGYKIPAAAQRFISRDWYRDRKRAATTFREMFKFLPAGEQPISWKTRGRGGK